MASGHIVYGIDLGTTNSSIAHLVDNRPEVVRTDTNSEILPSAVYYGTENEIFVGDSAINNRQLDIIKNIKNVVDKNNFFSEFKRMMGTNKSIYNQELSVNIRPQDLSKYVLQKLVSFTEDNVNSAVITVPTEFGLAQKEDTKKAGESAGIQYVELMQEPIAASLAYGFDFEGYDKQWIVFDMGGGTLDIVLLRNNKDVINVIDTEGDNFLGGKNIDFIIVEAFLLKLLWQRGLSFPDIDTRGLYISALKRYAELAKIRLSYSDKTILMTADEVNAFLPLKKQLMIKNLNISQTTLRQLSMPVYEKAVSLMDELLERNDMTADSIDDILLVGGATYSPVLRNLIEKKYFTPNSSLDPLTAVSKGAAIYAATRTIPKKYISLTKNAGAIQLDIGYSGNSLEYSEPVSIKLSDENDTESYMLEIERRDGGWSNGKMKLDGAQIVHFELAADKVNEFDLRLYKDGKELECVPNEILIIQGLQQINSVLPFNIGIEIDSTVKNKKKIFKSIYGLEKNKKLPAYGVINNLRTRVKLVKDMNSPYIRVPLYQGQGDCDGSKAIHSDHIYDIRISGKKLPESLPANSQVDIFVEIDKSEQVHFTAYFPFLNYSYTIDLPIIRAKCVIDPKWLKKELASARSQYEQMYEKLIAMGEDIEKNNDLHYYSMMLENQENDETNMKVLQGLRKFMIDIEKMEYKLIDSDIINEIRDELNWVKELDRQLGDEMSSVLIDDFELQFVDAKMRNDKGELKKLLDDVNQINKMLYRNASQDKRNRYDFKCLCDFGNFEENWDKADELIKQGMKIIHENPNDYRLSGIVDDLESLDRIKTNTNDIKKKVKNYDLSLLSE